MDHMTCPAGREVNDGDTLAPVPVTPVIGLASTTLAGDEFQLVSFDKSGYPQPLPPGLGHLPLYPDDDGYFSVNGPPDFTALSPYSAHGPVNNDDHAAIRDTIIDRAGFLGENPHIILHSQPLGLNDDDIRSGPQGTCATRSNICHEPDCTWRSSFPTKQALDRHHEVKHLNKRVDCPIPGCEKVGDKGIKRKDNLPAHVLNKHGIKLPRQSRRN